MSSTGAVQLCFLQFSLERPSAAKPAHHGFVVRIFCIAMAYGPLDGRVALSGIYRCLPVHPVLSAELAGTMTPSDFLSEYLVLAHRTTLSLIVLVHKSYSNANATFVYLPAVSYWKCSRAHVMVETSFVCHGRTEPVRPLATFSPTALGSWAQVT